MTLHYHGTPITPVAALYELAGRCFCVSFVDPRDVARCHQIGQSVMLDNGAFTQWRCGYAVDWPAFYAWAEPWLSFPTTWAVIPDVIDGGESTQDALLEAWPFGHRGAPVWHMDESIERLLRLCEWWPKVCIGSTAIYADVLSDAWCRRMDSAFDQIARRHRFLPWLHMLRGLKCCDHRWPFASVDSSCVAQNHHRETQTPLALANKWDAAQCPGRWHQSVDQMELI